MNADHMGLIEPRFYHLGAEMAASLFGVGFEIRKGVGSRRIRSARPVIETRVLRPRWTEFVKPHTAPIVLHEKHGLRAFGTFSRAGGFSILPTTPGFVLRTDNTLDGEECNLLVAIPT